MIKAFSNWTGLREKHNNKASLSRVFMLAVTIPFCLAVCFMWIRTSWVTRSLVEIPYSVTTLIGTFLIQKVGNRLSEAYEARGQDQEKSIDVEVNA